MRVAIIALILSIAALGLGSFATFSSLDNDGTALVAESGWSETECESAREVTATGGRMWRRCVYRGDSCAPYIELLQAANDNCE